MLATAKTLAAGTADHYTLTVTVNVAGVSDPQGVINGCDPANPQPGSGLYNNLQVTMRGVPNTEDACPAAPKLTVTKRDSLQTDADGNGIPSPGDTLRYTIVITNTGQETVQLRTRHWIITDASGRQQEVRGEGVVGEQPVLGPGEQFKYTSGVPLSTASGFMSGRYQMVNESGERFEIDIPTFSLDSPEARRTLN